MKQIKQKVKRGMALLLSSVLVAGILPGIPGDMKQVLAADEGAVPGETVGTGLTEAQTGKFPEDNPTFTWTLDTEGTLTITGEGDMPNWQPVDVGDVYDAPWMKFKNNITKVTVDSGVTSIGAGSFFLCSNLTEVTLPDGLTAIGECAFGECKSLASITIPENVTSIGSKAFSGCTSFASITIPENVTSIGSMAFTECIGLTSITIPKNVTTIGDRAFYKCNKLTTVTFEGEIPPKIIGENVFRDAYNNYIITTINVPAGKVEAYKNALSGNVNLETVKFLELPTITTQPQDARVDNGETATFTIAASGNIHTYQWKINKNDGNGWVNVEGANATSYSTSAVDLNCDGYQYKCVVANSGGGTVDSGIATLNISKYTVTVSNGSGGGSYAKGETVTITAAAAPEGQRFREWTVVGGNTTLVSSTSETTSFTMPADAVSVKAVYETLVTISGTDASVAYTGAAIDVSKYFTIDSNAGAATYSILTGDGAGTGAGSLNGSILTVTKTGTFVIKVSTAANGNYAAGEKTITLTVADGAIDYTAADYSGTYDGQPHGIAVNVTNPAGTTVTYSTDGINYSTENPMFTDAGTYTVYYQIQKENYNTVKGQKTVTITPAKEMGLTGGDWKLDNGKWWYAAEDGSYPANGWTKIEGEWYAFDETGYMETGWYQSGNDWYYLGSSGAMETGWVSDGGTWYYMDENGAMETGWVLDGDTWYYMNESGAMKTGWVLDGNTWYYMNASGAMQTGWVWDGANWYYLNASGAMQTGWIFDGANWYYLYSNGAMAHDVVIGGYRLSASGAWVQ